MKGLKTKGLDLVAPDCKICTHFLKYKSLKQRMFGGFSPICTGQGFKFTPNVYGTPICTKLFTTKKNQEEK